MVMERTNFFKYWVKSNLNIFKLGEGNLKMPVWKYNDKYYSN